METVLPTLATKEDIAETKADIARLEGKIDAMGEQLSGRIDAMGEQLNGKIDAVDARLDAKIDAISNRLLIRFSGIAIAAMGIGIAAAKYL